MILTPEWGWATWVILSLLFFGRKDYKPPQNLLSIKVECCAFIGKRWIVFRLHAKECVCVSFPHQRLGWKQFWVLPGMQELVLKWLTKLLSCKRSTKHYLGIRGGEGKIKGDVEFWMEYLIHLFQNHASRILWPLLKETWTNQSLAFSSFVHRGADKVKLKLLTEAVLLVTSISLSHYKYILNVFYSACTNDSIDQRVFHL